MRFRDKDYVRTHEELLFNIVGYEHAPDRYYACLKYVSGQKWVESYQAAVDFLSEHFPCYVETFIQVPLGRIARAYDPGQRWQQLLDGATDGTLEKAVRLGSQISSRLNIPITDFGLTDSLLWGQGHAKSDIDLVVYGARAARCVLAGLESLYADGALTRPDPSEVLAPFKRQVADWPQILERKRHMGVFDGTPFSLRAVRAWDEISANDFALPASRTEYVHFEVVDHGDSLFFPAIYRNSRGQRLMDFSVIFEGVLRPGDVFVGICDVIESTEDANLTYVVREDQISQYQIRPR